MHDQAQRWCGNGPKGACSDLLRRRPEIAAVPMGGLVADRASFLRNDLKTRCCAWFYTFLLPRSRRTIHEARAVLEDAHEVLVVVHGVRAPHSLPEVVVEDLREPA